MYIDNNIWCNIKSYLFHDINIHGKHLENDKHIANFNKVMFQLKRSFVDVYYCLVQFNRTNILKELGVYRINKSEKYTILTTYSILNM